MVFFLKHARLLDLLLSVCFFSAFSGLGFQVHMCAHASCMHMHTVRMLTHTLAQKP